MAPEEQYNPCSGPMGFITIFVMMFVVMIMFDPGIGEAVVSLMDGVMTPIKFNDTYPIWTIVLSGLILVVITTFIRHRFTDWYGMAKTQKIQSEFNKELREATMAGNTVKAKKLQEMQPEILKLTNQLMMNNMKTMIFTMLFAILIWRWLFSYLDDLAVSTVSLPWEPHFPMTERLTCFIPFPYWILIYFVVSVPIGQVLVNVFKTFEFSKDVKSAEQARVDDVDSRLDTLKDNIDHARSDGVPTAHADNLRLKVETALEGRNFGEADKLLLEAEGIIEQNLATRKKTIEMITTTREMLDSAKAKGIGVATLEPIIQNANDSLMKSDFTKAIYYCKQCQEKLRLLKEKHAEAQEAVRGFKEQLSNSPQSVQRLMKEKLKEIEKDLSAQNYTAVMEEVRHLRIETEGTQKQFEHARDELEKMRELHKSLRKMSLESSRFEDRINRAEDRFNLTDYSEALELSKDLVEEMSKVKKLYEDAQESVSFAKLVVANAQNFGAAVGGAESMVADAELALQDHDYSKALSLANEAKNIAEEAKRQVQREQKRGKR